MCRRINRSTRFITVLLLLCSMSVFALPEDDEADIQITSEQFTYNHQTGVATYTGDVLAVQGSRKLTGDEMQVYRLPNGKIEKIITLGEQAKYQALTENDKPMLYARANTIVYDVAGKQLRLIHDAHVEQGGDAYASPLIEYDTLQRIVKSPQSASGRTTITLQPQNEGS